MITREDVSQYVYDTLPWTELDDWDIDGIVDDMIVMWPGLLRIPSSSLHLGPSHRIDEHIDSERYWQIVRRNHYGE